jgi:hypothetical protein
MDLWPAPHERHSKLLREARAFVRRLEEVAERKLAKGEEVMGATRKVNPELILADAGAGLSVAAIAQKHHCARSTVSYYLHPKERGSPAEGGNGEARPGNGARKAPLEDQVAALERLTEIEWQRLPVVERVRLLLSRGSA